MRDGPELSSDVNDASRRDPEQRERSTEGGLPSPKRGAFPTPPSEWEKATPFVPDPEPADDDEERPGPEVGADGADRDPERGDVDDA